jgi:hypothetical protein
MRHSLRWEGKIGQHAGMKRRVRWIVPIVLLAALGGGLWWANRPEVRVLSSPYPTGYLSYREAGRSPWINVGFGRTRLQFPKPIPPVRLSPSEGHGFAGFLDIHAELWPRGRWDIQGTKFAAQGQVLESIIRPHPGGPVSMDSTRIGISVPYALRPEFQVAQLDVNDASAPITVQLPLAPAHREPPLEPTSTTVGPWTITARPRLLKTTASPVEFEITVSGPDRGEMLIDYPWIHHAMWGYNPRLPCGITARANKPFILTVSARREDDFVGVLHEVVPEPLEFTTRAAPASITELYLGDKKVYALRGQPIWAPGQLGYFVFRYGGDWFGNGARSYSDAPDEEHAGQGIGWRLGTLPGGQTLHGVGYKLTKSYPFTLKLKRPVTDEILGFGTQPHY